MTNKLFWVDPTTQQKFTYQNLFEDLSNETHYSSYCQTNDYYTIFKHVILSLLLDQEITILDSDFSQQEIIDLGEDPSMLTKREKIYLKTAIHSHTDLLHAFQSAKNWKIHIYTSGTTGIPKKIGHSFQSITRGVRTGKKFTDNSWGFAYNPTHIAGLQVFFQAIMNGNTLIRLFELNRKQIFDAIEQYYITHISATPTFFRLLMPAEKSFPSVQKVTSGGEKYDAKLSSHIQQAFPRARILNIYASTEAGTVLVSKTGDIFYVKDPSVVKIEENELYIHKNLVGYTEKPITKDGWLKTGDLVEIVSTDPLQIKFIQRKSSSINIGGYNVNPEEVETAILSLPDIQEALIYAKENSVLGNILYADIVTNNKHITVAEIRKNLQQRLQEFKIPRMINFVDQIQQTRTGKKQRW